jgi:Flp pilus assembly protein protease CpaA
MGAGDGKYLATFILVVPNKNSQIIFLIYLMIVIIAATLPSVIYAIRYKEKFEKKPFAPIILIAWTLYVLTIMAKAW